MKTTIILSAALLLALSVTATSYRVNNQGFGADYLQIDPAIAAASNGDTIYVEPSSTQYLQFNVNKAVVVIGVGYFLTANNIPGVTLLNAVTGTATMSAANSKLLGIHVNAHVIVQAANVTIQRCLIQTEIFLNPGALGTAIIQNMIGFSINCYYGSGHVISNNFITRGFLGDAPAVVTQNTINGGGFVNSYLLAPANSTASNNIYYNFLGSPALPANTLFQNNIGTVNILPAGNGNVNGVSVATLFAESATGAFGSTLFDNDLILAVGSPAIDAGVSGEDCGMFGGNQPYRLSGLPPIPRITAVLAPNVVSVNQPFDVSINAQSEE